MPKDHLTPAHAQAAQTVAAQLHSWLRGQAGPGPLKAELPETYEYDTIRETYASALTDALLGYASSGGRVTSFTNMAKRAVLEAVSDAIYRGFDDAGADELENDDERWLTAQQQAQIGFLPDVFAWIKEQRDAETITEDAIAGRVEMWLRSLDSLYGEAKMRGSKNKSLVFDGEDGDESCDVCQGLKGKRHKISWILENDAIPRPGNAYFTCQGYRCQHFWMDPKTGERYTFG